MLEMKLVDEKCIFILKFILLAAFVIKVLMSVLKKSGIKCIDG